MTVENETPDIPVVCTECDTRTRVPFDDVEDAIARHNAQRHDGDAIAQVDPDLMEELADRVARDTGLLD